MDIFVAHHKLDALGIPVLGVYADGRIDFAPEATAQQKDEATNLLRELIDAKPMERKTTTEVSVEIALLTREDRDSLINLMLAQFLVDQPHLAEKLQLPVKSEKEAAIAIEVKK